ncbi:MAG: helix-turn-helix domain-containing protein [Candidatus Kariarchaeaceae archaeon]
MKKGERIAKKSEAGEVVASIREQSGLTGHQFAKMLGISYTYLLKIEGGDRAINQKFLDRLKNLDKEYSDGKTEEGVKKLEALVGARNLFNTNQSTGVGATIIQEVLLKLDSMTEAQKKTFLRVITNINVEETK